MSFWHRPPPVPADNVSRTEVILARKPPHGASGAKTLIQVKIPRHETRQVHQRNEDRCVYPGIPAQIAMPHGLVDFELLNLSSNGAMVALPPADEFIIGEQVEMIIGGCDPVPMSVRWIRNNRMGLEFAAETAVIASCGLQDLMVDTIRREQQAGRFASDVDVGPERRGPTKRHSLMWLCSLSAGETEAVARVRNISSAGAMVSIAEPLTVEAGGEVILAMGHAGDFRCCVRWRVDGEIGLEFFDPFPVSLLETEPCVETVDDEPSRGDFTSREEAMAIRYTGMSDPTKAPDMEYKPLTLRELYYTLYEGYNPSRKD